LPVVPDFHAARRVLSFDFAAARIFFLGFFAVAFSPSPARMTGARSGKHGLPEDLWSLPVRFGVKSCYGTQSADLIVSKVAVQTGQ